MDREVKHVLEWKSRENEAFQTRRDEQFLPDMCHWDKICCNCGGAPHEQNGGACYSRITAAVNDAIIRAAFKVTNNGETLQLKNRIHTQTFMHRIANLNNTRAGGTEVAMVPLHATRVWGPEIKREFQDKQQHPTVLHTIYHEETSNKQQSINPNPLDMFGVAVDAHEGQYMADTQMQEIELSMQLISEAWKGMLLQADDEPDCETLITYVKDWNACQLSVNDSGYTTTDINMLKMDAHSQWADGKTVPIFLGDCLDDGLQKEFEHRQEDMFDAETLPDPDSKAGQEQIQDMIQVVMEHLEERIKKNFNLFRQQRTGVRHRSKHSTN